MTADRGLVLCRIAVASAVAFAIVSLAPNSERLFASFARAGSRADIASVGWLGAALTNGLYESPWHYGAIVCVSIFAALLGLLLVEHRARRATSAAGAILAVCLAASCSLDALRAGGGTVVLALTAAVVLVLEFSNVASLASLGVLAVVWCNVDSSGLLAPGLAVVAAIGRTLDRDAARDVGFAWGGVAVALGATLCTPLGVALPAHALAALQLDGASADYALWSPADVAPHGYRVGLMLVSGIALAAGLRGRSAREAALSTFAFVAALASGAFVPLFGIVAGPSLVRVFLPRAGDGRAVRRRLLTVAGPIAFAAVIAIACGLGVGTRALPIAEAEPYAAIGNLARAGGVRRVFCSNAAWCDAALARGLAVLADGRIANAPANVRDAQIAILRAKKTWRAKIASFGVDAVVAKANSPLATLLVASHWRRFAGNDSFVILVNRAHPS